MIDTRKPVNILIVEDDALVAGSLSDLVAEIGLGVAGIAASGTEALALAAAARPGLALIDIGLVGAIDGVDLACRLRRDYAIPAIFISGLIDPDIAQRAQAAQPLGLLQKPFRPSEVFNAIARALAVTAG